MCLPKQSRKRQLDVIEQLLDFSVASFSSRVPQIMQFEALGGRRCVVEYSKRRVDVDEVAVLQWPIAPPLEQPADTQLGDLGFEVDVSRQFLARYCALAGCLGGLAKRNVTDLGRAYSRKQFRQ
jgi:hypothetical protein